jgi:CubicO group peptidase (beta-lactamase class C family)
LTTSKPEWVQDEENAFTIQRTGYALALLLCLACGKDDPTAPVSRYPEAANQNFDVDRLGQAMDHLAAIPGIRSINLGRNGAIAAEEYHNDGEADVIHDERTVTKRIMGLLIGIAIREGFIESVDQTIGEFLEGSVVDTLENARANLTIKQLLTMSCGLEWYEFDGGGSYNLWYHSEDHVNWVLDKPFIHEPGNGFNYNTGGTHLLSVILTQATGRTALEIAHKYLFGPMGITQSNWTIVSEAEQHNNGGAGLTISPRAMFAIGSMVMNSGKWNQQQIVPAEWINRCTSIQNTTNDANPYGSHYGYLWWIGQAAGHDLFFAMGWGGQFIVCAPDLDLVVATTCQWGGVASEDAYRHLINILTIIMEEIIPSVGA